MKLSKLSIFYTVIFLMPIKVQCAEQNEDWDYKYFINHPSAILLLPDSDQKEVKLRLEDYFEIDRRLKELSTKTQEFEKKVNDDRSIEQERKETIDQQGYDLQLRMLHQDKARSENLIKMKIENAVRSQEVENRLHEYQESMQQQITTTFLGQTEENDRLAITTRSQQEDDTSLGFFKILQTLLRPFEPLMPISIQNYIYEEKKELSETQRIFGRNQAGDTHNISRVGQIFSGQHQSQQNKKNSNVQRIFGGNQNEDITSEVFGETKIIQQNLNPYQLSSFQEPSISEKDQEENK